MNSDVSRRFDAAEYGRIALTFVDNLSRLKDLDDIRVALADRIRSFGIEHFVIADLPSRTLDLPLHIFIGAVPPAWMTLYLERSFVEEDPIVLKCMSTSDLFEWDDAIHNFGAHQVMSLAGEYGLRHGLSFSVRQPRQPVSCISLMSANRLALDSVTKPAIHLMALYAISRAQMLGSPPQAEPPALSKRELEVLKWSAVGKTSGQIADILQITERTALAHAIKAATKLGASNRSHAVAKALAFGLIAP